MSGWAETWARLRALMIKELLAVSRDPRSRVVLIVPPLVQLLVFSFAATLEVTRVDVMILNDDAGQWSREVVQRIEGAPPFRRVLHAADDEELNKAIVRQQVIAAVRFDATFSRNVEAGRPASAQIILDGRKSNTAQIVAGYLNEIIGGLGAELQLPGALRVGVVERAWFNPNLIDIWYMVPSLVAVIALLMGLIVTALSIARERELGTFDQLMVSPLRTHEILAGKVIPPMMIGLVHITIFNIAAVLVFRVPFEGSLIALYVSSVVFLFSVVGVGLFISTASATQQQAILGTFVFLVPAMVLSGFVTPIENMPEWLQPITCANPVRYFLIIVKGVFLKDLPLAEIWRNTAPMLAIGAATMLAAAWLFRRRLE